MDQDMGWEAFYCLAVVALVFWGLMKNYAPDALLLGAVVLVTLAGIVTPREALVGFSNAGMLTVGALFVVAAALRETGALDVAGSWVLGGADSERGVLLRMAPSITGMSAFLNNTPIVAMFIPIVTSWCRKHRVEPSRLLIPLSYLAILGGTCTLIGTSTNLVIDGLMRETSASNPALSESLHPMRFFELGYVGVPYAIIGIAYLLLVSHRLLPSRKGFVEKLTESSREYLVNMRVQPDCRLDGQSVQEARLRQLPGLFLVEISREGEAISPVPPDQILRANDILTFTGVIGTIVDLERIPGLVAVPADKTEASAAARRARTMCEAVVSPTSPVIGISIRDADFRARYNAVVIAVHRGGERLAGKVGDIALCPGDTLLLQTGPHFARANRNNPDFLLVGGLDDARPVRHDRAMVSLGLLMLLVVLMVSGVVGIVVAAFLIAGLMVLTRCISVADARRSVDWQTLITIAAAFGLSKALVNSGLVPAVGRVFVELTRTLGPYGVLAAVYLMTSLFTEVITNNAAAALVFPFAVAISGDIGANPRPFVMAVAFAASASFMTPLGYQTNLMVYGPGGYRVGDFVRIGLPLNLILLACATILIPVVWPF
jgi:di/tricarboxylate transporter